MQIDFVSLEKTVAAIADRIEIPKEIEQITIRIADKLMKNPVDLGPLTLDELDASVHLWKVKDAIWRHEQEFRRWEAARTLDACLANAVTLGIRWLDLRRTGLPRPNVNAHLDAEKILFSLIDFFPKIKAGLDPKKQSPWDIPDDWIYGSPFEQPVMALRSREIGFHRHEIVQLLKECNVPHSLNLTADIISPSPILPATIGPCLAIEDSELQQFVEKAKKIRGNIAPLIRNAINSAKKPVDLNSIWLSLIDIVEHDKGLYKILNLSYIPNENSIRYTDSNDKVKFFSKDSFRKRLAPNARGAKRPKQ